MQRARGGPSHPKRSMRACRLGVIQSPAGWGATLPAMVRVKICGITSLADALVAVEAGADALGLNFWPGTARCVAESVAADIAGALRDKVLLVGVFVDASYEEIVRLRDSLGLGCVQLHG